MRKFPRRIAVFLLLQGAVFAAFVLAAQRAVDPYIRTLRVKHQHLANSPKPRLILVGGSGLAFGIQSELLKKALPAYAPANLGLHAGMGLDFILADALRDVERGDLVLLCLEFEIWPVHRGAVEQWEALLCRPGTACGMNKRWLADDGLGFVSHVTTRALQALRRARPKHAVDDLYSDRSFNAYGDFVGHRTLPPIRPMTDGDSHSTEPLGCEDLQQMPLARKFVTACEERGAQVVIFFPPIPTPLFELHRAEVVDYVGRQREAFGDRVLGRLEDIPMDENLFFDGIDHLTWEGGARRTQLFAERLKASAKFVSGVDPIKQPPEITALAARHFFPAS
jgi:hypothetical protein